MRTAYSYWDEFIKSVKQSARTVTQVWKTWESGRVRLLQLEKESILDTGLQMCKRFPSRFLFLNRQVLHYIRKKQLDKVRKTPGKLISLSVWFWIYSTYFYILVRLNRHIPFSICHILQKLLRSWINIFVFHTHKFIFGYREKKCTKL